MIMRGTTIVVLMLLTPITITACKNGEFSSDGSRAAPAASPSPSPTISPVPSATVTPSPCVGDGLTQAKLLTTSIVAQAANQYLDYDVQLTDCNGNPKALSNAALRFDLDAMTDAGTVALPYELSVSTSASNKISDKLQPVPGSDLFGKKGPMYSYWQTQSISFVPESATIRLRIDVSNRMIVPINSISEKKLTAPISVPTYLKLGEAAPVQQNVTVSPGV